MKAWKLTRWLVAALLLLWSGSPGFQAAIDDLYITTAFAHELVDTGRLQWTSGEVVEGITSIPWTLLLAFGPLFGIDAGLWARLCSVALAMLFLGLLSRRAEPGLGGTLLLWTTAAWTSFSHWALSGFEMTPFAGLVALGWTAVVERRWKLATGLLIAAALVRPEGWALALAGACVAWRDAGARRFAAAVVLALLLWSGARFAYFGALLPTPFLVKFVANPHTAAGLAQGAGDLVVAVGVLCATAVAVQSPRASRLWLASAPLLLGLALLMTSDGDWFASGRMTLAGVLTLAYASGPYVSTGSAGALVLAGCGLLSGLLRAPYGYTLLEGEPSAVPSLFVAHRAPMTDAYAGGFRTPLLQELAWVSGSVPDDACLLTADVGMVGNIEGVCIRDRVGLVDRAYAEYNGGLGPDPKQDPSAGRIVAERIIWRDARPEIAGMVLDASWAPRQPGDWALDFWRRPEAPRPSAAAVAARWRALAERYPWQPDLWWGWGVFAFEAGEAGVIDRIRAAAWRWPRHILATEAEELLSFADRRFLDSDYVPGRGFTMEKAGERRSRLIGRGEQVSLLVDADAGPVTLLVGWSGDRCPTIRSEVRTSGGAYALPPTPCADARVSVWYTDDGAGEVDRNAFVRLRTSAADDAPLPEARRADLTLEGEPPAEWIADRGWAMWWNRTLSTQAIPVGGRLELQFEVDAPGDDGARASLTWDPPCAEASELRVTGPTALELKAPCSARLAIAFLNDQSDPGDRNLYVRARTLDNAPQ